jgi:hypothetical protein
MQMQMMVEIAVYRRFCHHVPRFDRCEGRRVPAVGYYPQPFTRFARNRIASNTTNPLVKSAVEAGSGALAARRLICTNPLPEFKPRYLQRIRANVIGTAAPAAEDTGISTAIAATAATAATPKPNAPCAAPSSTSKPSARKPPANYTGKPRWNSKSSASPSKPNAFSS